MREEKSRPSAEATRRGLLAAAGGTAAAVAVGSENAVASAASAAAPTSMTADVVVVGAGISGLTAARRLVQAGVSSVIVLEASDRVGGRLRNEEAAPGVITEVGGQWVGPGQDRVLGLIDELGVELFPTFVEGKSIYHRKGRSKSFAGSLPPLGLGAQVDWLQLQTRLERMAASVPVEAPWNAPKAKKWDGVTAGDWLDSNSVSAEGKWLFTVAFKIIFGEDLHETSLLMFLHTIAACGGIEHMLAVTGGAQESRVVGGSERIPVLMADRLGRRVVLSSPVSEIEQIDDTHVIVRSDKATVRCKRVILAMPPANADHITFAPDLPVRRALLQGKSRNGTLVKLAAVYDRPFWRRAGFSGQAFTDIPIAPYVSDNSPPDGSKGILITFMVAAGARDDSDPSDELFDDPVKRKKAFLDALVTLFGPAAARPINYVEKDWINEPWISGCVPSQAPGVITCLTDAFTKPVGRIHWAGTEAGSYNSGYMDGAVRAAERAASEVLSAL